MRRRKGRLRDLLRLVHLSARLIAGRRFWVVPLLVLPWTAFQLGRLAIEGQMATDNAVFEKLDLSQIKHIGDNRAQ